MFVPSAMFCWAFFPHSWDGGEHLDHYHSASGGACVDGCFRAGKALVAVLVGALVRWPAPGWRASRSHTSASRKRRFNAVNPGHESWDYCARSRTISPPCLDRDNGDRAHPDSTEREDRPVHWRG